MLLLVQKIVMNKIDSIFYSKHLCRGSYLTRQGGVVTQGFKQSLLAKLALIQIILHTVPDHVQLVQTVV